VVRVHDGSGIVAEELETGRQQSVGVVARAEPDPERRPE